MYTYVICIIYC